MKTARARSAHSVAPYTLRHARTRGPVNFPGGASELGRASLEGRFRRPPKRIKSFHSSFLFGALWQLALRGPRSRPRSGSGVGIMTVPPQSSLTCPVKLLASESVQLSRHLALPESLQFVYRCLTFGLCACAATWMCRVWLNLRAARKVTFSVLIPVSAM